MKPIVLVLLVAASAFAAPSITSVGINVIPIEQSVSYDSGVGVNGILVDNVLTLLDNGDMSVFTVMLEPVIEDLANLRGSKSKALAVAQVLAVLQQLAYGIPGDSCAAASAINSYVNGGSSQLYLSSLRSAIDAVAKLAINPLALRYSAAPTGGCQGGGRNYNYEAAWNGILANANANNIGYINEEYCVGKRLANSNSVLSNNVGAALTASSLPGVVAKVEICLNPLTQFLRAAVKGYSVSYYAGLAKSCIA